MKILPLIATSVFLGSTAFAESFVQIQITARYEGFDRSRYAELPRDTQVSTTSGERCLVETKRETQASEASSGKKSPSSGVALDFVPVLKDGKIALSGKIGLWHRLRQDAVQPLSAMSFETKETFFNGAIEDGKELTLAVGDGPKDNSRIILTARLVTLGPTRTAAK